MAITSAQEDTYAKTKAVGLSSPWKAPLLIDEATARVEALLGHGVIGRRQMP